MNIKSLSNQLNSLTRTVMALAEMQGIVPDGASASHEEPRENTRTAMAVRLPAPARKGQPVRQAQQTVDNTDPNTVIIHITEGQMRNRITIPREIFVKSGRDSYSGSTGGAGGEVADPARSVVVIDGEKYHQTPNQGRTSKIQPSTFGITGVGQVLVLTRVKANQWVSALKGKAQRPAGNGKGQSAGSFRQNKQAGVSIAKAPAKGTTANSGRVKNPFAPKAQAKPTSKAASTASWTQALTKAVASVKANAKAGFYNENIRPFNDRDYRVYLKPAEHKAFKAARDNAGINPVAAVNALTTACEK